MRLLLTLALGPMSLMMAASHTMNWTIDGQQRQALVYTPTTVTTSRIPLVFVFHGFGDTAKNFSGVGFQDAWKDAIIVYPQAAPPGGWQNEPGRNGDGDLKLFDQMLTILRQQHRIDDARIYATGFSSGAKFTYLLWAERPAIFAAFAPVSGQHAPSLRIHAPKPLLHIVGTEDHQNEYALQVQSIEMARRVNGTAAPVKTVIHGGGHVYPDGTTETIVRFFQQH